MDELGKCRAIIIGQALIQRQQQAELKLLRHYALRACLAPARLIANGTISTAEVNFPYSFDKPLQDLIELYQDTPWKELLQNVGFTYGVPPYRQIVDWVPQTPLEVAWKGLGNCSDIDQWQKFLEDFRDFYHEFAAASQERRRLDLIPIKDRLYLINIFLPLDSAFNRFIGHILKVHCTGTSQPQKYFELMQLPICQLAIELEKDNRLPQFQAGTILFEQTHTI
jgi:hypothetical protein